MDGGADTTMDDGEKFILACAEACGVERGTIENICPASEEQVHRMDHHIETGSYMMQIVLQCEGVVDSNFLLEVLNGIRFKNHVLRTKLIPYRGQTYQVILRDSLVYHSVETRIEDFLAQNSRVRMGYGTPLLRYAFIQDPRGESFCVWSVHCCAVDNRTLSMLFDDLQIACSDVTAYCKSPPRPAYGRYTRTLGEDEKEQSFWLSHHTAFDSLKDEFPMLGPGDHVSPSTMRLKKLLHLPKVGDTEFGLPTVGYAAWAFTIASLRKQEDVPLQSESVSFIIMTSARRIKFEGIKEIMGPVSARVPLRISLSLDISLETLMRSIEDQLKSMIGFEHCAMKALHPNRGLKTLRPQAVFSWNPPSNDLSSKRIIFNDKGVDPAVLAYREDLSVPYAHDYGLLFEVYDHEGHVAIFASWEHHLVSKSFISRLVDEFERFLTLILKSRGLTVREVLSKHMADHAEETD